MFKSSIKISAEREGEHTLLKECGYTAPYKVIHYGSRHLHEHLELIMMSSSPGILEGDEIDITVEVQEGAQLKFFTQSFGKLHPMEKGATQRTQVQVKQDGIYKYIPHPIIPFAKSDFKVYNEIHLDESATLIWGDIIGSGRVHSGESFEFTRLHSVTKVYRDKKLVLLDNQLLEPGRQPLNSILFYEEGYTHQATLIYVSPFAVELKEELDEILATQYEGLTFGFTQRGSNVVMIRAMGDQGALLYDWLSAIGQLCWQFTRHKQGLDESEPEEVHVVEPTAAEAIPVVEKQTKRSGAKRVKKEVAANGAAKKAAAMDEAPVESVLEETPAEAIVVIEK
ncbi:urease accessory protein UreD [Pontibacter chinhatensis]|uniref:Urease accessory protein UreD n=1 Tax=Pontibacter chinhatensis TaxID=1436961 RepID=A0A1I2Z0V0_9BACT|nr:urease accessory protein UreD [Pontibacter chinhatensis]SFH31527.1 urease accessory protein [Pontibacter chinhatensis]